MKYFRCVDWGKGPKDLSSVVRDIRIGTQLSDSSGVKNCKGVTEWFKTQGKKSGSRFAGEMVKEGVRENVREH